METGFEEGGGVGVGGFCAVEDVGEGCEDAFEGGDGAVVEGEGHCGGFGGEMWVWLRWLIRRWAKLVRINVRGNGVI